MAGSNLIPVKVALHAGLSALLAADKDVVVGWSYTGRDAQSTRKHVYMGSRTTGEVAPIAMAAGTRVLRSEELSFALAVEVWLPGEADTRAAETAAMAIGSQIDEWFAGNWLLGQDIGGLVKALIGGFELDSAVDDDGAEATLTRTVQITSSLR